MESREQKGCTSKYFKLIPMQVMMLFKRNLPNDNNTFHDKENQRAQGLICCATKDIKFPFEQV